jgi:tRNA threonylcarbamoyl adenosine modification protein (Sua5/YciO/YrdC/YwlC family)
MTETIPSDADDAVARATAVLDEGLLAVVPTDTLYALAADALNEDAVLDVFRVKARGADQALPVCVAGFEDVGHVAQASPLARRLADAFWPGALTLVMRAKPWLPEAVTAGGETVAVRAPGHAYARALAARFGPYTVTSANRHGQPPAADVRAAREQLGGHVRLYVDGGTLLGTPSTIVDATGAEARVIREGAIPSAKVLDVARR